MRDTGREAETQAEGEAGSMQGTRCGTKSQDSRITPWAEGRYSTTEPFGIPGRVSFDGGWKRNKERNQAWGFLQIRDHEARGRGWYLKLHRDSMSIV